MSHACMSEFTDIGRADLYEHKGRKAGVRIQAAIAGARRAEQSTFMHSVARQSGACKFIKLKGISSCRKQCLR